LAARRSAASPSDNDEPASGVQQLIVVARRVFIRRQDIDEIRYLQAWMDG
jgi:hypothetical protein